MDIGATMLSTSSEGGKPLVVVVVVGLVWPLVAVVCVCVCARVIACNAAQVELFVVVVVLSSVQCSCLASIGKTKHNNGQSWQPINRQCLPRE